MAKQESLRTSECPIARTVEVIGERWCLMIIREAFDDVRRFSDFQKTLAGKNIPASRLKLLVEVGVLESCPASDGSAYKEYLLTERDETSSQSSWRCASGESVICLKRRDSLGIAG